MLLLLLLELLLVFVAIGDFVEEHPGIGQQVIPSGSSLELMQLLLQRNLLLLLGLLLLLLLGQPRGQLWGGGHRCRGGSPKHAEATSVSSCSPRTSSCSRSSIAQSIALKFAVPGLVEELGELAIHCSRTHAHAHTLTLARASSGEARDVLKFAHTLTHTC
uniref:(northern house mosquito) hypothetical protein n=1 Tax=Culex pipiens TaxID=7175 RepID=A0A8D8BBN1_CULPI